jgi:parallel beta-helix repeat protein
VVNGCTIQNNNYWGVAAMDNSALIVVNSTITSNGRAGVSVSSGSSGRIGEDSRGNAGPNTIQNNGSGISVYQTARASITNNTIQNNTWQGVFIEGASARLTNNVIRSNWKGVEVNTSGSARLGINDDGSAGVGNIIESNQLDGISIAHSGSAYMLNNTMRLNGQGTGRPGVKVYQATGRLVGGNTIEDNGGHGVEVDLGALFQGVGDWNVTTGPDLIRGNAYSGISGWNSASLDIRKATVTNNTQNGIVLSLQSTLRIYDSTVTGNSWDGIRLYDGSSVARYSTNTPLASITNNSGWGIICSGGSTLVGGTGASGVSGNLLGQVNCP